MPYPCSMRGAELCICDLGTTMCWTTLSAVSARQRLTVEDPQIEALIQAKLPADLDLLPGARYLMGLPFGTEIDPGAC